MLGLVSIWETLLGIPLHGSAVFTTQQIGMLGIAAGVGFWLCRHPGLRAAGSAIALEPEPVAAATQPSLAAARREEDRPAP
jgi:hypothetical protein